MDLDSKPYILRPAKLADYSALNRFINLETQVHRHLDWRPALDWLGEPPFLLIEQEHRIEAVLACQADPPETAWVRLFASASRYQRSHFWRLLLNEALQILDEQGVEILGVIALQDWIIPLLKASNFENYQDIVVLEWDGPLPPPYPVPQSLHIRPMLPDDIPPVSRLDRLCFPPMWQNSQESITLAYEQSAYSTIAEIDGRLAGFQISTGIPLSGHMARLAVHPDYQRTHIGAILTRDMLQHFYTGSAWHVTLNTQNTNHAALKLYTSLGFHLTGETFPVYQYRLAKA